MKTVKVIFSLALAVSFVTGCTQPQDETKTENQQKSNSEKVRPTAANRLGLDLGGQAKNDHQQPAVKPFKKRVHKDGKGIIGKTTNEIVDFQKAIAENPKLKIVRSDVSGSDPLSQSMSLYSLGSRVQMLAFKHDVDIARNLGDGKPLSYEAIVKRMKVHNIELNMLFAWQKYAYDARKGDIMILEDPELKAQILDQ